MLTRVNKIYLIIASVLYLYFLFFTSSNYFPIYLLHIFSVILYFCVLMYSSKKALNYYSKWSLIFILFIFSFFLVGLYNFISYVYNNNFFVFSEVDALTYHNESLYMASQPFLEGIKYYMSFKRIDDLGAILIHSSLYRLIESNLLLNFFYILIGIITVLGIYRICTHFLSKKYAFVGSLSYGLASYVLWFHASGLKESFMVMLVVLFFDRYYLYLKKRNITHLIYASLFLIALLFFRPPLIFFCIGAVALSISLQRKKGFKEALVIILVFVSFVAFYPVFKASYDRFLMGGDLSRVLTARESMIVGSLEFTYGTNILAQLIGPLPTISPDIKVQLSFYSAGLIFKALLSIFFWFGVYYVFKYKVKLLYPLIMFSFFEMVSLILILEGLELRKSLPHFPFIYIIAFWFLDKYDLSNYFKNKKKIKFVFNLSALVIFIIILLWNLRYNVI